MPELDAMMQHPLARWLVVASGVTLFAAAVEARDKTDTVYFVNGDSIRCEIQRLQRGKLTVKSIGFGTVHIEWDEIAHVESVYTYDVVLRSGTRYLGTLSPGPEPGKLEMVTTAGTTRVDHDRVVAMDAIDARFLERIDGAIDVGYEYTLAASSSSWNLAADALYRSRNTRTHASLDSLAKSQEGADTVERNNLQFTHMRYLREQWFGLVIGQGENSSNQALQLRALLGGGIGHILYRSDRTTLAGLASASFSREKYDDNEDFKSNAEVVGGVMFDMFRFDSPELDLTSTLLVFTSLTELGRYRIQWRAKLRFELVKDFYLAFSVFESYDSQPPSELANKTDFGLSTSFGWSF